MTTFIQRLRLFGIIGILAASLMFMADCIFMDSSSSGKDFGSLWLSRMVESPNWRLTLGGIGGPLAACVFVVGFAHVYLALKPSGKTRAFICAAGFCSGYIVLGAWHAIGPLFAFIHRTHPDTESALLVDATAYMQSLGTIGVIPIFCALLVLPLLILSGKSLYPRWFALINPGLIYTIGMFLFAYIPAPVGGFMVIGNGSFSFMVFFIVSTIVLWNSKEAFQMDSRNMLVHT